MNNKYCKIFYFYYLKKASLINIFCFVFVFNLSQPCQQDIQLSWKVYISDQKQNRNIQFFLKELKRKICLMFYFQMSTIHQLENLYTNEPLLNMSLIKLFILKIIWIKKITCMYKCKGQMYIEKFMLLT